MQKIVAVWLWFEFNNGLPPNKKELRVLLGVTRWSSATFERAFRSVIYRVLGSTKGKNYYIDTVPDIMFNISKELSEAKNFELKFDEKVVKEKKKTRFLVLSR